MMNTTIKNARILIVDDNATNIDILHDLLEVKGYTNIESTTDPRQVLSLFKTFDPDIILLDLMMPYLTGFQVMEQLKPLIPASCYMPILVLTADVTVDAKQRALAGGAKRFFNQAI